MLKAAGDTGIDWLTSLANEVVQLSKIPDDWKNSIIVPVFKGKGTP